MPACERLQRERRVVVVQSGDDGVGGEVRGNRRGDMEIVFRAHGEQDWSLSYISMEECPL